MDIRNLIGFPASGGKPLGVLLNEELRNESWINFHAAVAFVKRSGVKHLSDSIANFSERGVVKFAIGVDLYGTSIEGVETLCSSVANGEVWVYHNELISTFHPKLYIFSNENQALVIVGSGNLTEGGLYTNEEISLQVSLDLSKDAESKLYKELMEVFDSWSTDGGTCSMLLNEDNIISLIEHGYLVPEKFVSDKARVSIEKNADKLTSGKRDLLFGKKTVTRPKGKLSNRSTRKAAVKGVIDESSWALNSDKSDVSYLMTLQQTDAGSGQTTPGKSKRSPEIFIPLAAKKANEAFWGWPEEFVEDPAKAHKLDRKDVPFLLNGKHITVNMMTWPDKSDFRLRCSDLRDGGSVGDILKITPSRVDGTEYEAEFISPSNAEFEHYNALCNQIVRNSKKKWGYIS
ncbi:hypothetical protein FCV63_00620 [Vibrio lentus]|uniref:phospholipase D family protein n=1 Tax=Vibrio lentus TaxID=136468 RepID=UPI0010BD86FE|nr:phospholipase D family protein [Vibrio lentus]TKF61494.1 hypothetical protein FCV63_00620 [Vibrio lentus]